MGRMHYFQFVYHKGLRHYRQALSAAQEAGDSELIALSSSGIGQMLFNQGRFGKAEALFDQAVPLFEQIGNRTEWFRALTFHGGALAQMGDYAKGLAEIQRARAWAQEANALSELINSSLHLNGVYAAGGDLTGAIKVSRQAVEMAEESGDRIYVYVGYVHQGWSAARAKQYDLAAACVAKAEAVTQELGSRLGGPDVLATIKAEIAYGAEHVQEAITLAERAVDISREVDSLRSEGLARRTWGQALAALAPPRWDEAETQLAYSVRLFEEGQARLEAARTHVAWGTICCDRGDLDGARAHWEQAAAQWEASGLNHELARTHALLGGLTSKR
jgi:tetratricopeptide (TPR) repeat protein